MVVSETRVGGLAPLAGVRILDATVSVSGAFCSTLLARLGAAVTRLDLADDGAGPRSLFLDEHLRSSEVYAPYLARRDNGLGHHDDVGDADSAFGSPVPRAGVHATDLHV
jgi:hypothetical protein